jgi:hypothetical protein
LCRVAGDKILNAWKVLQTQGETVKVGILPMYVFLSTSELKIRSFNIIHYLIPYETSVLKLDLTAVDLFFNNLLGEVRNCGGLYCSLYGTGKGRFKATNRMKLELIKHGTTAIQEMGYKALHRTSFSNCRLSGRQVDGRRMSSKAPSEFVKLGAGAI